MGKYLFQFYNLVVTVVPIRQLDFVHLTDTGDEVAEMNAFWGREFSNVGSLRSTLYNQAA